MLYYWHAVVNRGLTTLSNMTTGPQPHRHGDLLQGVPPRAASSPCIIEEDRFGFEPEITAKVARAGARVYEVPISYHGRTYEEGKKIGWKDGFRALYAIAKYSVKR